MLQISLFSFSSPPSFPSFLQTVTVFSTSRSGPPVKQISVPEPSFARRDEKQGLHGLLGGLLIQGSTTSNWSKLFLGVWRINDNHHPHLQPGWPSLRYNQNLIGTLYPAYDPGSESKLAMIRCLFVDKLGNHHPGGARLLVVVM